VILGTASRVPPEPLKPSVITELGLAGCQSRGYNQGTQGLREAYDPDC
jgi:hypothetical protein